MFAKKNRISKQKDFDYIFKNGKTIKNGFFKIVFLKNELTFNRFAIVVNKKVSNSAVLRNKIKRIIRKEIKNIKKNNHHHHDLLIIVFPKFLERIKTNSNELEISFSKIFIS